MCLICNDCGVWEDHPGWSWQFCNCEIGRENLKEYTENPTEYMKRCEEKAKNASRLL